MRYGTKVIAIVILTVFATTGGALAVGYEHYYIGGPAASHAKAYSNTRTDFCAALKKATFVEKVPGLLDDAAAFIKDVLGQFGLAENKAQ
ncbi:MAG: hypothetical protein WBG50_13150 [Desulfomonilaceae bacterium]